MEAEFIKSLDALVRAAKAMPKEKSIRPDGKAKGMDFQPLWR
jgi:hypothetical protein